MALSSQLDVILDFSKLPCSGSFQVFLFPPPKPSFCLCIPTSVWSLPSRFLQQPLAWVSACPPPTRSSLCSPEIFLRGNKWSRLPSCLKIHCGFPLPSRYFTSVVGCEAPWVSGPCSLFAVLACRLLPPHSPLPLQLVPYLLAWAPLLFNASDSSAGVARSPAGFRSILCSYFFPSSLLCWLVSCGGTVACARCCRPSPEHRGPY